MKTNFDIIIENHVPPTVYSLCESICYTNNTPCRIMDLAKFSRETIFNFDYPLTSKVDKEKFEINIINYFLMRRINGETFTAWQLALYNKLNEIMPYYNKLLDSLDGWDLFKDGEVIDRVLDTTADTETNSNAKSGTSTISDRRFSDMPDNQVQDIQNGRYLTNYNYDSDVTVGEDKATATGTSTSKNIEKITRTPSDKISIYKEFLNEQNNIYKKIYKDLDVCFYGLYE